MFTHEGHSSVHSSHSSQAEFILPDTLFREEVKPQAQAALAEQPLTSQPH